MLDEIEGVERNARTHCWLILGASKNKGADIEELCAVLGMTEPVAKNIMEWSLKSSKERSRK